jgi:GT2 family glycosyltransferase
MVEEAVMRIDLGTASYQNPDKLDRALSALRHLSTSEWRCLVVDNNSPDPLVKEVISKHADQDSRIIPRFLDENLGYAGAVNQILEWAETNNVGYIDNDAYVQTHGWDEKLALYLEANHELAMVFPNGGSYMIQRPRYAEILWGVGFCWMLNRQRYKEIGGFDTEIGHQEEVDFQTRLRLGGWRMAAAPEVHVRHDASSTRNPAAQERINQGVINWVNKWNKYFSGQTHYHSPNVIRYEDWPPVALYMEEWYHLQPELQGLNEEPETVYIAGLGREVDLIKVPRWQHLYRGRII